LAVFEVEDPVMSDERTRAQRVFLRDDLRLSYDFAGTDQRQGRPVPALQQPSPPDALRISLPDREAWQGRIGRVDLETAIARRESHRRFAETPLMLEELAFLLWSTQGLRRLVREGVALRTVPSAGCRHAFESWVFVQRVEGLEPGLWRYLPLEHALERRNPVERQRERLTAACLGQDFCGSAAATIVWSCVPYRMEWRYGPAAHRVILLDAGHVCQNLYLACEAIGAGTCAVAAYDQRALDALLGLDGEEEFAVYLGPVGKLAADRT
jgi:SagB-type dehydrogenase family enzyme